MSIPKTILELTPHRARILVPRHATPIDLCAPLIHPVCHTFLALFPSFARNVFS